MKITKSILLLSAALAMIGACGGDAGTTSSSGSTSASGGAAVGGGGQGGEGDGGTNVGAASQGGAGASGGAAAIGGAGGTGGGDNPGPFGITSTAYADMGMIPLAHACSSKGGSNLSPPLTWTPGPSGTESYAIVFVDLSNGLTHSAIWDIPKTVLALPEGVEGVALPSVPAGAKQCQGWNGDYGYQGPCPGTAHNYQFQLHAVDVASLSISTSDDKDVVKAAVEAASVEMVTLTGTFTPP